ncbi:AbgT family transporter [Streptomonospora wellingtoniae]|uniref:AbgT family transporter n=1 Tax=Streptomonospora wellingtoniae TaxID=3075544 RepID=A0ABU2KY63_9ACTN|nr:AbgT family transporter [Streptomonospora sp. DSM 45055]MDT0304246.1 AbgT family transporter [Streptomonospora sp. DSM 45055]
MAVKAKKRADGVLARLLGGIERAGNRLPHPFMLFIYLALFIAVVSWLVSLTGATVADPETGEQVAVRSLLSGEGLVHVLTSMLPNFVEFPPLGLVLTMMLGIGLAQRVGLLETLIKRTILKAPRKVTTAAIILTGICGNLASDAAFIVIPPLAAVVFLQLGRHPLAGLAAGFAAVGSGFSANFMIAGTDALLSGISTEAAGIVDDSVTVSPLANYFFMAFSVVLLTSVGVFVTHRIVEPRLGAYEGTPDEDGGADPAQPAEDGATEAVEENPKAGRGLRNAGLVALAYIAVVVAAVLPSGSPLRGENGAILESPLLEGVIPILLLLFVAVAVAYGTTVGAIRNTGDVPRMMAEAVRDLSGFLVLMFAAAQAIAWFDWTRLGLWVAVNGAVLLEGLGIGGLVGLVAFSLLTVVLSMLIASGSALWAVEAPAFVPMFMLNGINPAYVQAAYRIADSSTNSIVPLSPYIAVMIGFMQKYDKKAGLGTLFALMVPYTVTFYVSWLLLFIVWTLLGIPIGPGESLHLPE